MSWSTDSREHAIKEAEEGLKRLRQAQKQEKRLRELLNSFSDYEKILLRGYLDEWAEGRMHQKAERNEIKETLYKKYLEDKTNA